MKIELTFDTMPDPRLSANGRRRLTFWDESKLVKAAKENFTILLRDAWNRTYPSERLDGVKLKRSSLSWVLTYPNHRRRDVDNIFSSLKVWVDVLVIEGILVDDDAGHVSKVSLEVRVEKGVERTELTIEEVE